MPERSDSANGRLAGKQAPDVLVLGGGGLLGEVWMNALLSGLEQAGGFDARESGCFIGTSAGSIVAAALAAGVNPRTRLGRVARDSSSAQSEPEAEPFASLPLLHALVGLGAGAAAPLSSLALSSPATTAAGALLRRTLLARVPAGRRSLGGLSRAIERLDVQWDGRLRVAAVDRDSGRRVMFGAPGAPGVSVAEAVVASCAIPGVFEPLRVGERSYVDGGVWSPTNMDTADVSRGTRVLCLNPTGSIRPTPSAPAGAFGALSRSIAGAEALALRHRGASVRVINPDEACRRAMGVNLLDPGPREAVIAAGLLQGRRSAGAVAGRAASA
jgi:NTE family protein